MKKEIPSERSEGRLRAGANIPSGQSALTEFGSPKRSRNPKHKPRKALSQNIALNITSITNKIAAKLVREKLFKNKKEALEAAVGFFLIWYTNPEEFEKLNAKRNNAPPETIRTVQDITSDILRGLPIKKSEEPRHEVQQ